MLSVPFSQLLDALLISLTKKGIIFIIEIKKTGRDEKNQCQTYRHRDKKKVTIRVNILFFIFLMY